MKILGIETSCDETAVAIVEDGRRVLANVIFSQASLHAVTGGVVPEVAAREHILKIIPVLDEALRKAECDWSSIDAVAVTKGPGLISSLIIGTETASVISYLKDKPLIPVHHVLGHVYANFLEPGESGAPGELDAPEFPILILTVSGGHNELLLMRDHGDFVVLGETRDDAAGEAFDKVARILGLGYPGGPAIAKAALAGSPTAFDFPRAHLESGSLDFSFSGLKTSVLTKTKEVSGAGEAGDSGDGKISEQLKADLAASFQEAVVDVLTDKVVQAFYNLKDEGIDVREIHLAGGVSANSRLREVLTQKAGALVAGLGEGTGLGGGQSGSSAVRLRWPKNISHCTDNAAMIAAAGYALWKKPMAESGAEASAEASALYKAKTNITPTTSFDLF